MPDVSRVGLDRTIMNIPQPVAVELIDFSYDAQTIVDTMQTQLHRLYEAREVAREQLAQVQAKIEILEAGIERFSERQQQTKQAEGPSYPSSSQHH